MSQYNKAEPRCDLCGDVRPPYQSLCPECEDRLAAARTHDHPPGDPLGRGRVPRF